jgi:two-component system sensor histidine kinase HydH
VPRSVFYDLKEYVGFDAQDEASLRALHPFASPRFAAITEDFYQRILDHEAWRKVLTQGESSVGRLKATLVEWMDKLLTGPWDDLYFDLRCRIGRVHVRIGMPQHFMFGAMNVVRRGLQSVIDEEMDLPQRPGALRAMNKILDLELAIMLHTYREDLEAQQARVERLATFGQLVGSIGHELRNPLGVMETSLYILKGRNKEDERTQKHVARIDEQLQIANSIITDLLDMIRNRQLATERISLRSILDAAVPLVAHPPQVELQLAVDESLQLHADASQLRQVFVNLLQNAADACGASGVVKVDAVREEEMIAVAVQDTGPGVDLTTRRRLFEPLITTKQKGIGLGLALVKRIVEQHGGTVAYEPKGPGARFVVRLQGS